MESEDYTVYMHIFPNKKKYIGITLQTPQKRWQRGLGYRGTYIGNAIKKYGWVNIKHEILYENLTKEQAEQKEIELIAKYKSNQREYGYNIANGGMHYGKTSEETKKKISQANSGEKNGMYGKVSWNKGLKMNEETRKKLSLAQKGRKLSPETIKKLIEAKKEKYPNGFTYSGIAKENIKEAARKNIVKAIEKSKKSIKQYGLNGVLIAEYKSISDASLATGIAVSNISHVCLKKRGFQSAGGYIWRYSNDTAPVTSTITGRHRNVIQYDKDDIIVKKYTSIKEASFEVGVGMTQIIKCCQGKGKTAGGFIWKYE